MLPLLFFSLCLALDVHENCNLVNITRVDTSSYAVSFYLNVEEMPSGCDDSQLSIGTHPINQENVPEGLFLTASNNWINCLNGYMHSLGLTDDLRYFYPHAADISPTPITLFQIQDRVVHQFPDVPGALEFYKLGGGGIYLPVSPVPLLHRGADADWNSTSPEIFNRGLATLSRRLGRSIQGMVKGRMGIKDLKHLTSDIFEAPYMDIRSATFTPTHDEQLLQLLPDETSTLLHVSILTDVQPSHPIHCPHDDHTPDNHFINVKRRVDGTGETRRLVTEIQDIPQDTPDCVVILEEWLPPVVFIAIDEVGDTNAFQPTRVAPLHKMDIEKPAYISPPSIVRAVASVRGGKAEVSMPFHVRYHQPCTEQAPCIDDIWGYRRFRIGTPKIRTTCTPRGLTFEPQNLILKFPVGEAFSSQALYSLAGLGIFAILVVCVALMVPRSKPPVKKD